MTRKLLNDIRKQMIKNGFLLQNRIIDGELSKPIRPLRKFPRKLSRFDRTLSDKQYINKLKIIKNDKNNKNNKNK